MSDSNQGTSTTNVQPQVGPPPGLVRHTIGDVVKKSGLRDLLTQDVPVRAHQASDSKAFRQIVEEAQATKAVEAVNFSVPTDSSPVVGTTPIVPSTPPQQSQALVGTQVEVSSIKTQPQAEVPLNMEPDFESEVEIAPEAQNFKKLRAKYKATNASLKELNTKLESTASELEKYKTGEALPEVVAELKGKVAALEPLQEVVNLKTSPAYKAKLETYQTKTSRIKELSASYGISEVEIERALNTKDERTLNGFLSSKCDSIGGTELKVLIRDAQGLKDQFQEAEAKPTEFFEKWNSDHRALTERQESERITQITNQSVSSWKSAVTKVRTSAQVASLTPRENDPAFNENWVAKIENHAQVEYGKVVKGLAAKGIKALDPEIAEALATQILLGSAAAIESQRANAAEAKILEFEKNSSRVNSYLRPTPGQGASGSSGGVPAAADKSPQSAGARIWEAANKSPLAR